MIKLTNNTRGSLPNARVQDLSKINE